MMTNEQLAILLGLYHERIETEIDYLRDCLDGNQQDDIRERQKELWHIANECRANPFVSFAWRSCGKVADGYEERPAGDFVILEGLKALLDQLSDSIETLEATE